MGDDNNPTLDENIVLTVLTERGWATEDEIDAAQIDIDMGMASGPLERRLLEKGIITEKDLTTLNDLCALPESIAGFKIIKSIGAGAMGVVYLAEDPSTQDKIALKVINAKHCDDGEFIKRFHRETKAVGSLKHANIAASLGSGAYKDQLYLAMEYIDGPSLAEILDSHGPIPEPYAIRTILQIAKGLEYANEKEGLIHRDIKPANILIKRNAGGKKDLNLYIDQDEAKIIDFGLAKSTDGNDDLTMTGMTMGTPHYMSPEQIRGDETISCQVDIYALGATLYHLLTGEPPFTGNSPGAIMLAHINNPIPNPDALIPSIKTETVDIVKTALAKDCSDRFGTFQAVIRACENALSKFGNDSDTSMRILRKPMKIQNTHTVRKNRSNNSPSSTAGTAISNAAETMEIDSDSILKAHTAQADKSDASSHFTKHDSSNKYLAAESALRKIQTDRIRRESTKRTKRPEGLAPAIPTKRFTPDQSTAFDEDPINELGRGKLPWLVLSGAVLALILSLAARFF